MREIVKTFTWTIYYNLLLREVDKIKKKLIIVCVRLIDGYRKYADLSKCFFNIPSWQFSI